MTLPDSLDILRLIRRLYCFSERSLADEEGDLYDSVSEDKEEGIYGSLIATKPTPAKVHYLLNDNNSSEERKKISRLHLNHSHQHIRVLLFMSTLAFGIYAWLHDTSLNLRQPHLSRMPLLKVQPNHRMFTETFRVQKGRFDDACINSLLLLSRNGFYSFVYPRHVQRGTRS